MFRDFSSDKPFRTLLAVSLFLILLGTRAALIRHAGSPTPFMDEWDGDWNGLLRPYLEGRLTFSDLVAPFMEHRILLTRLTVLSIYTLSGYWDVVLQMIVNAILGVAAIVAISFALSRVLKGSWALVAIVSICMFNLIPFGFDNIVMGFNTHFYLLPILSLLGLYATVANRAWSGRWTMGALCGAASFFCMASGALTLAAALAAHLFQMACGRRAGLREWLGAGALAAATALMVEFIPRVPASEAYRAHSAGGFLSALVSLAGWPAGGLGLLLVLPSVLFCLRIAADRPERADPRWFNLAALAWVATQIVALAAGRAESPLQSRYLDTLALGLALHFVSALWLAETRPIHVSRTAVAAALAGWFAIVAVTLPHSERHLHRQIESWRDRIATGRETVRGYLATSDAAYFSGKPVDTFPYPESGELRLFLDTPGIRATLPPELLRNDPPDDGVEAFKRRFLHFGFGWSELGVLLLIVGLGRRLEAERATDDLPENATAGLRDA